MSEAPEALKSTGIVVGVDGSPLSVEALKSAARLAPIVGGPITAVTASQYPVDGLGSYSGMDWNPAHDAADLLDRALGDAFGEARPEGLGSRVVEGSAAHVLVELSREASLLVVGSRGIGGFMGLLLGSVSGACAEHAACPVLILHEPGDSRKGATASS